MDESKPVRYLLFASDSLFFCTGWTAFQKAWPDGARDEALAYCREVYPDGGKYWCELVDLATLTIIHEHS